jgi:hypothetical protein
VREAGGRWRKKGGGAGGRGRPRQVGPTCRRLCEREGWKESGPRGPEAGAGPRLEKERRGR